MTPTTPPQCIIVTGRPGAGKTTLAKKLGGRLHLPVLSRDDLKAGYVHTQGTAHAQLPANTNAVVSDAFFSLVDHYLTAAISLIIEAAFQHHVWAPRLARIQAVSRPCLILCELDAATAAQRHLARGLADPAREMIHGDEAVAVFRETGRLPTPPAYVAPNLAVPTLTVRTAAGYEPALAEVVAWLPAARS